MFHFLPMRRDISQSDVIISHTPQTRQDLGERCHNIVVPVTESTKYINHIIITIIVNPIIPLSLK